MERTILKKTPYLLSLEGLFKKYGITKAYSYSVFNGEKEDGVVLYVNNVDITKSNIIGDYMDNYMEDETMALPEQRSLCVPANDYTEQWADLVYCDGEFYTNV